MELIDLDVGKYLLCLGVALVVNYLVFRRILFSVLDPWIFIALNQVFNIGYALYAYIQNDMTAMHSAYLAVSYLAFSIGLYSFYFRREAVPSKQIVIFTPAALVVTICVIGAYQFFFDAIFFYFRGIPAFSPDGLKPTMYQGGFGVVKYIHDAAGVLIAALSFKALIFYKRKGLFYLGMFFLIYPMILMDWGKSGLVGLLFGYGLAVHYLTRYYGAKISINYRKIVLFILAAVAYVVAKFAVTIPPGYAATVLLAILKRFANSSDSLYMYFTKGVYQYLEGTLGLASYLFSHITPYFGYGDYLAVNLATIMFEYAYGWADYNTGYGTSSSLFVIGHLVLGQFGFIYCFFVGMILSIIKFTRAFKSNYVVFVIVYGLAPSLAGDASLALYYLAILLVLSPVIVLSYLMVAAVGNYSPYFIRRASKKGAHAG